MRRAVLMVEPKPDDPYDYFFGKNRLSYILKRPENGTEIDIEEDLLLNEMLLRRFEQLKQ